MRTSILENSVVAHVQRVMLLVQSMFCRLENTSFGQSFKQNLPFTVSATVLTFLFFAPFIFDGFGAHAGFLYLGDVINLWVPQIMSVFNANKHHIMQGLDLQTQGGASEIFLRPNLLTHSPLVLFTSQIVDLKTTKDAFRFVFSIYVIYTFLACFFLHKLCEVYFFFRREIAIFTVVAFCFSITVIRAYGFTPFIFAALMFPVYLYVARYFAEKRSWHTVLLGSFLVTLGLHVGYICFSALLLLLAGGFSFLWLYYIDPPDDGRKFKRLFRSSIPFVIAAVVHAPLFLAYTKHIRDYVTTEKMSLAEAAHNHSLIPSEIFGLITHNFIFQAVYIEQQIIWGMLAVSILILSALFLSKKDLVGIKYRMTVACAGIYAAFALCMYGATTSASYFFYYFLPAIGEMHYYQRYLAIVSLFFWIVVAIFLSLLAEKLDKQESNIGVKVIAGVYVLVAFVLTNAVHLGRLHSISEMFLMELLLSTAFVVSLLFLRARAVIYLATVISIVVPLATFYDFSRSDIWKPAFQSHENIVFNKDESQQLVTFFKANSTKNVIKYVDLVYGLNYGYLPKNYPWWVQSQVNLSSYVGYDMHLAADRVYQQLFVTYRDPVTTAVSYGAVNWDWLKKTEAEFVVYNAKEVDKSLLPYIDSTVTLSLSHDLRIARLHFPNEAKPVFDSGYFRLQTSGQGSVSSFSSNGYGNFSMDVDLEKAGSLVYLFWPSDNLHLKVDGEKASLVKDNGLYSIALPAGRHHIGLVYCDTWLTLFEFLYLPYLFACFVALIRTNFKKAPPLIGSEE